MLKQNNVWDRTSAAKGWEGLGVHSEATESALNTAMRDDYQEVQQAAEDALRRIGSLRFSNGITWD